MSWQIKPDQKKGDLKGFSALQWSAIAARSPLSLVSMQNSSDPLVTNVSQRSYLVRAAPHSISLTIYIFTDMMDWIVEFHESFAAEFLEFPLDVQDALLAKVGLLEKLGPQLGRPHVDTLYDSRYSNMKELRFSVDEGVWRTAFAFDPTRKAILLVAGNKSGTSTKRFYKQLLQRADQRFTEHIVKLEEENHD
jgi:hypothetical protein